VREKDIVGFSPGPPPSSLPLPFHPDGPFPPLRFAASPRRSKLEEVTLSFSPPPKRGISWSRSLSLFPLLAGVFSLRQERKGGKEKEKETHPFFLLLPL